MDVCDLLNELHNELEIRVDDPLVDNEIRQLRTQIKDCLSNIQEIKENREGYIQNNRLSRLASKIFTPYIMYLSLFMRNVAQDTRKLGQTFNRDFITVVLQKHLECFNNNGDE